MVFVWLYDVKMDFSIATNFTNLWSYELLPTAPPMMVCTVHYSFYRVFDFKKVYGAYTNVSVNLTHWAPLIGVVL